ncbi:MAG: DUF2652 domain-containing protein [bacterium]|nr:DUF2652 domain-containing protein [bacterium]
MRGHLVIADISGYTQFLTEGELEHAHGIITDLLNSIIEAIHAPLTVSSIQGDAVFMYGSTPEDLYGQTILETVESVYVSFASSLETMVLNTTCDCNACANINALGLKIVMHCGEFIKTEVAGVETLSGPDVITVHRLLKNSVRESTGIADYLLVTQQCVDELGLERIVASWTGHTESYEHVGQVQAYVSSLKDTWEFVRNQRSMKILEKDSWLTTTHHTAAAPAIVWDHMIDPRKRNAWMGADSSDLVGDVGGRVGPGSEYHCAHGDDINVFTVLDSRANEYLTLMAPFSREATVVSTHYLVPSGQGTRIVTYTSRPGNIDPKNTTPPAVDGVKEILRGNLDGSLERLAMAADASAATMAGSE